MQEVTEIETEPGTHINNNLVDSEDIFTGKTQ